MDELAVWGHAVDRGTGCWVLGAEDGDPALIHNRDETSIVLAFLDRDRALATVPDDSALIHTTLWASSDGARLGGALVYIATNGIALEVNPHLAGLGRVWSTTSPRRAKVRAESCTSPELTARRMS